MSESELWLKGSMYLFFNFLVVITTFMYFIFNQKNFLKDVLFSIRLSIIIQFLLSFLIFTSGTRQLIFFNNPNQLGYYGLLMITFLLLFSKSKIDYIFIIMSFYLILLSNSSAAIISAVIIISINIMILKINIFKKTVLISSIGFISILIVNSLELIYKNKFIANVLFRFNNKSENVDLISGRGYGRIFEIGQNIIWGVGEGANNRFIYLTGSELHSTFGDILVSYGIIGLILFLLLLHKFFVFSFLKSQGKNLLFIGVFSYWITHQGLRNSFFWILLVIFYIYIENKYDKNLNDAGKEISS